MDELSSVALFLIDQTSKKAKQHSQKVFDSVGLDLLVDQWVLLKIIEENIPMSQKSIAVLSHRDPASVTRTIDILERKSYVRREKMASDRRQYLILLTQDGKDFVEKHMTTIEDLRKQSLRTFTTKEVETLTALLLKMQANFI